MLDLVAAVGRQQQRWQRGSGGCGSGGSRVTATAAVAKWKWQSNYQDWTVAARQKRRCGCGETAATERRDESGGGGANVAWRQQERRDGSGSDKTAVAAVRRK